MATTEQVQDLVGANANTTANVEAFIARFILRAEAVLNGTVTFNFSDKYGTLNVDVQGLCTAYVAASAAMDVINYEPDAVGISAANLKLNVLENIKIKALNALMNKNIQDFVKVA